MKKLINSPERVLPDMLRGLTRLHVGLALVEGHSIVVRSTDSRPDASKASEVAIVSGGGSGHEPAHVGYVGQGMLSAAVCGDVFTSPTVDAVLDAIRVVATPAGVLLIVKNYTGDRLNFGLAAELARAEGIDVMTVTVADDVALEEGASLAGARGLAGTVLVHKIAGAAAASGLSLSDVHKIATEASRDVATMGVALSPCTVPASGVPSFELGAAEIEWGLGIHGEPGVRRGLIEPADQLVAAIMKRLVERRNLCAGDRVALLVNNLGATPPMEVAITAAAALEWLEKREYEVVRAWAGTFLTAIEMAGVSISLVRVDDERLALLDAPTGAPAWPSNAHGKLAERSAAIAAPAVEAQARTHKPTPRAVPTGRVAKAITSICRTLLSAEAELTRLDQLVGDGDLGISLARGANAVLEDLPGYPLHDLAATMREMSSTLRRTIGGTSGPLYSIGLLRAGLIFKSDPRVGSSALLASALQAAGNGISEIGGAREGDRTMLDALIPAAAAARQSAERGLPLAEVASSAFRAAKLGSDATAQHQAKRGRSSYLGARAVGHVDPGAHAIALWLESLAESFK